MCCLGRWWWLPGETIDARTALAHAYFGEDRAAFRSVGGAASTLRSGCKGWLGDVVGSCTVAGVLEERKAGRSPLTDGWISALIWQVAKQCVGVAEMNQSQMKVGGDWCVVAHELERFVLSADHSTARPHSYESASCARAMAHLSLTCAVSLIRASSQNQKLIHFF